MSTETQLEASGTAPAKDPKKILPWFCSDFKWEGYTGEVECHNQFQFKTGLNVDILDYQEPRDITRGNFIR